MVVFVFAIANFSEQVLFLLPYSFTKITGETKLTPSNHLSVKVTYRYTLFKLKLKLEIYGAAPTQGYRLCEEH